LPIVYHDTHLFLVYLYFSLTNTPTTVIYTLSLHDALPICCCHLKNIWTAPLPPETELSRQMTTSTTSIDIMGLQAAYANLHTDQERDYFMQRYHDVISSFGGKTSYDADN